MDLLNLTEVQKQQLFQLHQQFQQYYLQQQQQKGQEQPKQQEIAAQANDLSQVQAHDQAIQPYYSHYQYPDQQQNQQNYAFQQKNEQSQTQSIQPEQATIQPPGVSITPDASQFVASAAVSAAVQSQGQEQRQEHAPGQKQSMAYDTQGSAEEYNSSYPVQSGLNPSVAAAVAALSQLTQFAGTMSEAERAVTERAVSEFQERQWQTNNVGFGPMPGWGPPFHHGPVPFYPAAGRPPYRGGGRRGGGPFRGSGRGNYGHRHFQDGSGPPFRGRGRSGKRGWRRFPTHEAPETSSHLAPTASQEPVISEGASQEPVISSEGASQEPVISAQVASQEPVISSEGASQEPVISSEGASQEPVISSEGASREPVLPAEGEKTPADVAGEPCQADAAGEASQATLSSVKRRRGRQVIRCDLCRVDCWTWEVSELHKNGKKHKKNLERFEKLQKANKPMTEIQNEKKPKPELTPEIAGQPENTHASVETNLPIPENLSSQAPTNENTLETGLHPEIVKTEDPKRPIMNTFDDRKFVVNRNKKWGRGGKRMKTSEMVLLICDLCNVKCESQVVFDAHLAGRKHLNKLTRFHNHQAIYGPLGVQALYPPNPIAQTFLTPQPHPPPLYIPQGPFPHPAAYAHQSQNFVGSYFSSQESQVPQGSLSLPMNNVSQSQHIPGGSLNPQAQVESQLQKPQETVSVEPTFEKRDSIAEAQDEVMVTKSEIGISAPLNYPVVMPPENDIAGSERVFPATDTDIPPGVREHGSVNEETTEQEMGSQ